MIPLIQSLSFLLGCWQALLGPEPTYLVERYQQMTPALIQGSSQTLVAGRSQSSEYIEIESSSDGGVTLTTYFDEMDSAKFRLIDSDARHAVFETMNGDLPYRIVYERRDPGTLVIAMYGRENLEQPSHSITMSACAK